jgi:hypothetical protein
MPASRMPAMKKPVASQKERDAAKAERRGCG